MLQPQKMLQTGDFLPGEGIVNHLLPHTCLGLQATLSEEMHGQNSSHNTTKTSLASAHP